MSALENGDDRPGVMRSSEGDARVQDAILKMLGFHPQRLEELHLRKEDIATPVVELCEGRLIEVHILTKEGLAIDSLIVNRDLVFRDVVINDHLARTYHDHFSHLLRIQPADMDIDQYIVGIFDRSKCQIL